jgi:hypothetical protein
MRLAGRGISGHRQRLGGQKPGHLRGKMAALQEAGCIEAPCSDSTALGHELGPNGARQSQAAGNALAFAVQGPRSAAPGTRIGTGHDTR